LYLNNTKILTALQITVVDCNITKIKISLRHLLVSKSKRPTAYYLSYCNSRRMCL